MNRDQLLKQVECPVCMEVFRTPKQLPCQHPYCLQCLQTVFDTDRYVTRGRFCWSTTIGTCTVEAVIRLERAEARNQGASHICSICRVPDNTWRDTFKRVRHVYRKYLGNLLRNEKLIRVGIVPTMLIMAFSRLIAGTLKLRSDCRDEYNVAMYSFVKACFEFLLYGTLPFFYCVTTINRALNNKFVQVWFIIYALFTVIWFFIGTAWIFGKYAEMKTQCPKYVDYWNSVFINFISFLTGVDWIGAVIFVFYSLYCLCDTDDDNNAH